MDCTSTNSNNDRRDKIKERKKLKRKKYKEKMKEKRRKGEKKKKFTLPNRSFTLKHWKLSTKKNKIITKNQRKALLTINNLYNIVAKNQSYISILQSEINTISEKPANELNVHSTQHQTTTSNKSIIENLISTNSAIKKKIKSIENREFNNYSSRSKNLKSISSNKGHHLTTRLNQLYLELQHFKKFCQNRLSLLHFETAKILEEHELAISKSNIIKEQIKLSTTNKIHNFTDTNLSEDLLNLLNKGTNFIPTENNYNQKSLTKIITSETNTALIDIIHQSKSSSSRPIKKKKKNNRFTPYPTQNPINTLNNNINNTNFNNHLIDYIHNTINYAEDYIQRIYLKDNIQPLNSNISHSTKQQLDDLQRQQNITITQTDKNMGWALLPTSWFTTEYERQLSDKNTYKRIPNFDTTQLITDSNKFLHKLQQRFKPLFSNDKLKLLDQLQPAQVQLPYMKLLPKVHKITENASPNNLHKLTGRPIITAHSWLTSNISKLLGNELDDIINQLKQHFESNNITFPLINNSTDLIDILEKQHITNIHNYKLTTFDFSSLYTNISHKNTTDAIIKSCNLLKLSRTYRDFLLNLNNFINDKNFFKTGNDVFQQVQGIAMGSYHSRQIADLVLLLTELDYFTITRTNKPIIFTRYIDDGFLLTTNNQLKQLINNLSSIYPIQIPITFTSNNHNVHYLDLSISLNYHTIFTNKIHYKIYQKPNHKYMYPHFSSNHAQHIFSGIIKTETIRYSRLSCTKTDYNYILRLFTLRLQALSYPLQLIYKHTYPYYSYNFHKTQRTNKQLIHTKRQQTFYYKTTFNKTTHTDRIVQRILNKYHNKHIPKLTKVNSATLLNSILSY